VRATRDKVNIGFRVTESFPNELSRFQRERIHHVSGFLLAVGSREGFQNSRMRAFRVVIKEEVLVAHRRIITRLDERSSFGQLGIAIKVTGGACYELSVWFVGHLTKHGFRPVVRVAVCDERLLSRFIKRNLVAKLLFDLAVFFDDEG